MKWQNILPTLGEGEKCRHTLCTIKSLTWKINLPIRLKKRTNKWKKILDLEESEKPSLSIVFSETTQVKNGNRSNNQRHNWKKKSELKKRRLNYIPNIYQLKATFCQKFWILGLKLKRKKKVLQYPGMKTKTSQHTNQMKIRHHQRNKCPVGLKFLLYITKLQKKEKTLSKKTIASQTAFHL